MCFLLFLRRRVIPSSQVATGERMKQLRRSQDLLQQSEVFFFPLQIASRPTQMDAFAEPQHGVCVVCLVNEGSVRVENEDRAHVHADDQHEPRVERANVVALQEVCNYLLTKYCKF
jgi:hypothetical protein